MSGNNRLLGDNMDKRMFWLKFWLVFILIFIGVVVGANWIHTLMWAAIAMGIGAFCAGYIMAVDL